eukprot:scaffold13173_cov35-Tisochrysis_lutea.AAC.1
MQGENRPRAATSAAHESEGRTCNVLDDAPCGGSVEMHRDLWREQHVEGEHQEHQADVRTELQKVEQRGRGGRAKREHRWAPRCHS